MRQKISFLVTLGKEDIKYVSNIKLQLNKMISKIKESGLYDYECIIFSDIPVSNFIGIDTCNDKLSKETISDGLYTRGKTHVYTSLPEDNDETRRNRVTEFATGDYYFWFNRSTVYHPYAAIFAAEQLRHTGKDNLKTIYYEYVVKSDKVLKRTERVFFEKVNGKKTPTDFICCEIPTEVDINTEYKCKVFEVDDANIKEMFLTDEDLDMIGLKNVEKVLHTIKDE